MQMQSEFKLNTSTREPASIDKKSLIAESVAKDCDVYSPHGNGVEHVFK